MRVGERQPGHAPHAEPRAQPIDEVGEVLLRRGRQPIGLILILPFDRFGRQPHDIETKARIERIALVDIAGGFDLLAKQPGNDRRVAQRPAGAGAQMPYAAIDTEEAHIELACAVALSREQMRKLLGEREDRRFNRLALDDRLGKAPLGEIGRHLEARRDRRPGAAQQSIEPVEKSLAEPRGERRARPQDEIADAAQARLGKGDQSLFIEPQSGKGQRAKLTAQIRFADVLGKRRASRRSARAPRPLPASRRAPRGRQSPALRAARSISPRSLASPPKRCAAPVTSSMTPSGASSAASGVKQRHQSVIVSERRGLGRFVRRAADKAGQDGASIGQRQAGLQPMPRGGAIHGGKPLRAFDLGDSGERRLRASTLRRVIRSVASDGSQRER